MDTQAAILRVFTNDSGQYGNPLAVITDLGHSIPNNRRLKIAQQLGFSETVFINDVEYPRVSIFNPEEEIAFAGHALLGTAWYLKNKLNKNTKRILSSKNTCCEVSFKENYTWIIAGSDTFPPWTFEQLEKEREVSSISYDTQLILKHTYIWAWIDENKGEIRARTFAPDWGIPEDEANGSGSMSLALILNKSLKITHGKGSVILAKPTNSNMAEVGGRVFTDKFITV